MAAAAKSTPSAQGQEILAHERTYKTFNIILRWCMTLLAAVIAFTTLWFATDAGFVGGAIVGLIILFLGYNLLVKHEEHQPLDVWTEGR